MMINSYYFHSATEKTDHALSFRQCGWQNCDPRYTFGPFVRDFYLIHYIISGQGTFQNDFGKFTLSAGNGFLIRPTETTTYTADAEHPWKYLWVGFVGTEAERILSRCRLSSQSPVFFQETGGIIEKNMRDIIDADKLSNGFTYLALAKLYLIFSQLTGRVPTQPPTKKVEIIKKAVSFIEANYYNDLTVKSVADHLFINRCHLFKIFKETLGISPIHYIIDLRLSKACELLRYTNMSVTEVASYLRFADASSFCRLFKNKYNVTPLTYKKLPLEAD